MADKCSVESNLFPYVALLTGGLNLINSVQRVLDPNDTANYTIAVLINAGITYWGYRELSKKKCL